jgi:hypothetical protein
LKKIADETEAERLRQIEEAEKIAREATEEAERVRLEEEEKKFDMNKSSLDLKKLKDKKKSLLN